MTSGRPGTCSFSSRNANGTHNPTRIFRRKGGISLDASERAAQALVLDHIGLVRVIAKAFHARLPPTVEVEDLVGAGMLGLVLAARRYDPSRGVPFRSYARHRIRGAIRDHLRALDPFPRDQRKRNRATTDSAELTAVIVMPFSEETIAAPDGSPALAAELAELRRRLDTAIQCLPPRYQLVIRRYYECAWTMKEIGRELGVNESRVSQMHSRAIDNLRARLSRK